MKTIAVVVVSYNSSPVLPGLLDSLDEGMDGTAWRLIVVDNASTDGSADIVGRLAPDATVIRSAGNDGYAAGINRGVRAWARLSTPSSILNPTCVSRTVRDRAGGGADAARGHGGSFPRRCSRHDRSVDPSRADPGRARSPTPWWVPRRGPPAGVLGDRRDHPRGGHRRPVSHRLGRGLHAHGERDVPERGRAVGRVVLPLSRRRSTSRCAPAMPASRSLAPSARASHARGGSSDGWAAGAGGLEPVAPLPQAPRPRPRARPSGGRSSCAWGAERWWAGRST